MLRGGRRNQKGSECGKRRKVRKKVRKKKKEEGKKREKTHTKSLIKSNSRSQVSLRGMWLCSCARDVDSSAALMTTADLK